MNVMERTKINVVDATCGAGKTSWAVQKINDAEKVAGFGERPDKKYIYVTPFLEEVKRIIGLTKARFFQPESETGKGSKIEHFKMLVELGESIVTTHELFKRLDSDTLEDIEAEGYTLIMDEVANVLEPVDIGPMEIEYLLALKVIEIDEMGKVTWLDEKYGRSQQDKKFKNIKIMADNDNLFILQEKAFYWTMNVKAFEVFDEVYILTYLFDGQMQKYYYNMFNVEYAKHCVKEKIDGRYELIEYDSTLENRKELYDLLNIYDGKLNHNYDFREKLPKVKQPPRMNYYQLSSGWFEKAIEKDIDQLRKNLLNYFGNVAPTPNGELFWTTLTSMTPRLKDKKCKFNKKNDRTKDNFLPFNVRATNDYSNRTAMAFVYNRFMNPNDKQFFTTRDVIVNEDLLAVSDLIQFLFRGCIRNGEPMNCYIPSERMRSLLKDWSEYKI